MPGRDKEVLRAHVARNNPALAGGERRRRGAGDLPGRRGYISPTGIRASRRITSRCRPGTMPWCTPHGRIRVLDDVASCDACSPPLTTQEAARPRPWKRLADAPRDYLEAMVAAVVGIEIEIDRLVGQVQAEPEQGGGGGSAGPSLPCCSAGRSRRWGGDAESAPPASC